MDKKAQMMDAGTALFQTESGFGTALGQLKAELSEYGDVSQEDEDLILDFSTAWRKRFISCHLEDAGMSSANESGTMHRYAAVFKEGNRSTLLRTMVCLLLIKLLILGNLAVQIWFPDAANFVLTTISTIAVLGVAYYWITPSRHSIRTARTLICKLNQC